MSRSPEYYAAVFAVLEDADGRVLLLERTNTGWLDGSYGLPSGHVEPGEMPSEAMVREALEEVGVRPVEWTPFAVLFRQASSSDRTYSDFYFRVTRWEWEPTNAESDKCAGISWHRRDALPDNIIPSIRHALSLDSMQMHFIELASD